METSKRCVKLLSLIFILRCLSKFNLILILKFRQKFKFAFHKNLILLINRGNKIFQLPGLIFSRMLSIFKQELPEKSLFWRWLWLPPRAKYENIHLKMNKNLNDLKLIFLELVHQGLYSGRFWENRFFSILHTLSRFVQQTALNVWEFILYMQLRTYCNS